MKNVYRNETEGRRLVKYEGMKITPTDIDGVFDFKGKGLVLFEAKYKNAPDNSGQEYTLRRIAHAFAKTYGSALVLIVNHDATGLSEPVYLNNCFIRKYYYETFDMKEKCWWIVPDRDDVTVSEFLDWYINEIGYDIEEAV